jgi:hypothetical protein
MRVDDGQQRVPPRVLILGGYGNFGERIARRLLRSPGIDVVIAGRDAAAARRKAEELSRDASRPVGHAAIDAARANPEALQRTGATILVNASGPFQEQDYALQRVAIGSGIHCVDLADDRRYVTGIGALDAQARANGVLVVSGTSTVPALAAAAIDDLAKDFSTVETIDYGITPGNRTEQGIATVQSILSYLGKPFLTRRARAVVQVHGWQELSRERYPEIGRRWMGACDIPDLDLFPKRYAGLASLRFRAGAELGLAHLSLWLLSWPARIGLLRRPERLAGFLHRLRRRLNWLGSDAGGMHVKIDGHGRNGDLRHAAWYLVARSGHGPEIPAIASVLLARKLALGALPERGAMACTGLFSLREFLDEVADLDISTYLIAETALARVLGPTRAELPEGVRAVHDRQGPREFHGVCDVEGGRNPLAWLVVRLMGLPRPGRSQPLVVRLVPDGTQEHWTRVFQNSTFRSTVFAEGRRLRERVGIAEFEFKPVATADGLRLDTTGMRVLGIPVPRLLLPRVRSHDRELEDGSFGFDVEAALPLVGRLVRYRGRLAPLRQHPHSDTLMLTPPPHGRASECKG